MSTDAIALACHIACGSFGLALGPVAMLARKRPGLHTRAGELYHWTMLGVCLSAAALALLRWQRDWWFLPLALFSYAFALLGYLAAKLRWRHWLRFHVAGQGGSYIAMSTALLVVNFGQHSWWTWVLPTALGSPLIARVSRRIALGRWPGLETAGS
jgi:hypothetical protein